MQPFEKLSIEEVKQRIRVARNLSNKDVVSASCFNIGYAVAMEEVLEYLEKKGAV